MKSINYSLIILNLMMLNETQSKAVDTALNGHSFVLLGVAGTGKTLTVAEIVKRCCSEGKNVSVTCTTGIACTVYENLHVRAITLHKWAGIEDGRYPANEIVKVLTSNVKYTSVVDRIKNTDILIIDECSMLSKRTFELLNEVCSIKDTSLLFGGIQMILVVDFRQLAPVPNVLYDDDGSYCFQSNLFNLAIQHKITLTDIYRQHEDKLIASIEEIAKGHLTKETNEFILSLKDTPLLNPIKLFATNELVDGFNREEILKCDGELYEYSSKDSGTKKYLDKMLAPNKLWLKRGCPVILLRNISERLVNGLRGTVIDIDETGPTIQFPTVEHTMKLERTSFSDLLVALYSINTPFYTFANKVDSDQTTPTGAIRSVFNPRLNATVAEREQFPVKLAFALTIHKSQGLTLKEVEVNCQNIFKPGQLAVGMGRAQSSKGLRIKNFHPRVVIPQPDTVEMFYEEEFQAIGADKSCCLLRKSPTKYVDIYLPQDIPCCSADTDTVENFEDEDFDEDFNDVIQNIDQEMIEFELPQSFSINEILESLKEHDVCSTFQAEVNDILDRINNSRLEIFCKKGFMSLKKIIVGLKIDEPVPVAAKDLQEFSLQAQHYLTSAEQKLNILSLFQNEMRVTNAHMHICYRLSISIRKHLLQQKVDLFKCNTRNIPTRKITDSSKARIRYVGGYCIAKIRNHYSKMKVSNMYSVSEEAQLKYSEACNIVQILDNLREDEWFLLNSTEDKESLLDVTRKQGPTHGLTHIKDSLYSFFLKLGETCLSVLTDENLNKHGEQMYSFCLDKVFSLDRLYADFMNVINQSSKQTGSDGEPVESLIIKLFNEVVKKYLLVLFAQFRKDVLTSFEVEKTMAHRKQIQTKKTTDSGTSIKGKGKGKGKHSQMKKSSGTVLPSPEFDLQCDETDLAPITSEYADQPSTSAEITEEVIPTTSGSTGDPNKNKKKRSSRKRHVIEESDPELLEEEDSVKCFVCDTVDKDTEWIQCDGCENWFHRVCAGLKNKRNWAKFSKKTSHYYCNRCV